MTSDRIFNALAAHLEPKVVAAGGVFAPSETVAETLALLGLTPTSWRCILQWQRDDDTANRGESRAKFLLIVQQGKTLSVVKGADVATGQAGRDAILKRFNAASAWLRAVQFSNPDVSKEPMKQGSAYWLNDPTIPTRQIAGEFMVAYGLDAVDLEGVTIP